MTQLITSLAHIVRVYHLHIHFNIFPAYTENLSLILYSKTVFKTLLADNRNLSLHQLWRPLNLS